MRFNKNRRTFEGRLKKIGDKKLKLATIEVDCGDDGVAIFKIAIKKSVLGNPEIEIRTIKPLTGEYKKKKIMAVPMPRSNKNETVQSGKQVTEEMGVRSH